MKEKTMDKLSAQIETTLYVFGQRVGRFLETRSEKGQTTAEYVGIVAFVALLVVALIGMKTEVGTKVKEIIDAAFDKIKTELG
jgi:Flp pilus assembly pilin Flp